jgi:hypothetical protein
MTSVWLVYREVCDHPYQTEVVGVYSTQTAAVLALSAVKEWRGYVKEFTVDLPL